MAFRVVKDDKRQAQMPSFSLQNAVFCNATSILLIINKLQTKNITSHLPTFKCVKKSWKNVKMVAVQPWKNGKYMLKS